MTGMEITLRDVYDQQLRIADQVSQMRGDLSVHSARVDERLDNGQRKLDDHETRMRAIEEALPTALDARLTALERFRWGAAGAATLGGALSGGGIATLLTYLLSHH